MTKDLVFRDRAQKVMKAAYINADRVTYGSILAKQADCTYSHVVKLINDLVDEGLLEKHDEGLRIKRVVITDKGRGVVDNILKIEELMNDN